MGYARILGKPKNKEFLLDEFARTEHQDQRVGIIHSLYLVNDSEIAAFFEKLVSERFDDGDELYYPLNYLAKRCDPRALRILSGDGQGGYAGYPGCFQWGTTVELFGKCQYRPAIPYLINSINTACMNIGMAAVESLQKMYPHSPNFEKFTTEQIQQYFQRRAKSEKKQRKASSPLPPPRQSSGQSSRTK